MLTAAELAQARSCLQRSIAAGRTTIAPPASAEEIKQAGREQHQRLSPRFKTLLVQFLTGRTERFTTKELRDWLDENETRFSQFSLPNYMRWACEKGIIADGGWSGNRHEKFWLPPTSDLRPLTSDISSPIHKPAVDAEERASATTVTTNGMKSPRSNFTAAARRRQVRNGPAFAKATARQGISLADAILRNQITGPRTNDQ